MKKIILASSSPRRREILKLVGMDFDVMPSECEENIEYTSPADMVEKLSALKAEDIAQKVKKREPEKQHLIIGSDTTVFFKNEILGKPKTKEAARRMLKSLSGNTHDVYTGVTVIDTLSDKTITFYEKTEVTFFNVSDDEIYEYVETNDPMDKAGAYGVQGKGAFLVKKINGDYFTVVGLPVARLIRALKEFSGSGN